MASILYDELGITYDSLLGPTGNTLNYDGDTDIPQRATVVWGKRRTKDGDKGKHTAKVKEPSKEYIPTTLSTVLSKHKQEDIALAIALLTLSET